jgi:hypothetical protein
MEGKATAAALLDLLVPATLEWLKKDPPAALRARIDRSLNRVVEWLIEGHAGEVSFTLPDLLAGACIDKPLLAFNYSNKISFVEQPGLADDSEPFRTDAANEPFLTDFASILPQAGTTGTNVAMTLEVVFIDDLLRGGKCFQTLCQRTQLHEHEIFSSPVVKAVVMYKWKEYAQAKFRWLFGFYLALVASFTAWCFLRRAGAPGWLTFFVTGMASVQSAAEVKQLWANGIRTHFSAFANVYMGLTLTFVYVVLAADVLGWQCPAYFFSYTAILVWLSMLYFLESFESTGPYVRTIFEIMSDIKAFLFLYLLVNVAFTVGMNLHSIDPDDVEYGVPNVASLFSALLSTYRMGTLGDFEPSTFEDDLSIYLMFALCTFIVMVVFLNILIAVISDTFDKIQEVQESARVKGIAQAVNDIEAIFGVFPCPRYFFFSRSLVAKDEWSGRVSAITSAFESRCAKTDGKVVEGIGMLHDKHVEMGDQVDAKFASLEKKIDE